MTTTTLRALPAWPLARIPRTPADVWDASYTEFVAMVNQTNVPPGSYATLNAWATFGRIDASSSVLEVACTTGFSSRELARLTGCSATGFDLSDDSVRVARYNHRAVDPALRLDYFTADGATAEPRGRFTHVVVGAALGFFPEPAAMARRLGGFLTDGGLLLASPFWADEPLPAEAEDLRREVFGITSPMETYHEALSLYRGFDVLHETRHVPAQESEDDIAHYCASTVDRACAQSGVTDPAVRAAMTERLAAVRRASNRLRRHLRYSVLVLRYDRATYPARYVELF
ncbi:bifunctional 2-polyprenyl-6-hydroxyphenol methylase/3-demethylubiquinol 3-O-methyltransferase UbiG [Streptomyces sp. NRRL S-87]|uniref:class I SAM-dependent methyltransferase n=1 Tax=Streptomyces sp. NRRL S-87 TaxID=1463920 RepID=UPI0004C1B5BC|nr:class I SAM-dependent methyltransferase [Streptomyces sp. NRRL S-87]